MSEQTFVSSMKQVGNQTLVLSCERIKIKNNYFLDGATFVTDRRIGIQKLFII